MVGEKLFFDNTSQTGDSENMINTKGGVLTIQVFGETSSLSASVLGKVDIQNGDFVPLAGINMSDYSLANTITAKGIYEYDISGIRLIKVNLASTDGNVSIKGVSKEG